MGSVSRVYGAPRTSSSATDGSGLVRADQDRPTERLERQVERHDRGTRVCVHPETLLAYRVYDEVVPMMLVALRRASAVERPTADVVPHMKGAAGQRVVICTGVGG